MVTKSRCTHKSAVDVAADDLTGTVNGVEDAETRSRASIGYIRGTEASSKLEAKAGRRTKAL